MTKPVCNHVKNMAYVNWTNNARYNLRQFDATLFAVRMPLSKDVQQNLLPASKLIREYENPCLAIYIQNCFWGCSENNSSRRSHRPESWQAKNVEITSHSTRSVSAQVPGITSHTSRRDTTDDRQGLFLDTRRFPERNWTNSVSILGRLSGSTVPCRGAGSIYCSSGCLILIIPTTMHSVGITIGRSWVMSSEICIIMKLEVW